MMHRKTTVTLDEELLNEARRMTGIQEKTALIHEGLQALIAREAGRRLAAMGGTMPGLRTAPRRRARPAR